MSQDPMTTVLNLVQRARDLGIGEELYPEEIVRAARTTQRALSDDGRLTNFGMEGLPWHRADISIPGTAVAMSAATRVVFPQGAHIRHIAIYARTAPTGTYAIQVVSGTNSASASIQAGSNIGIASGVNLAVPPGAWAIINVTNAGGAEDVMVILHYALSASGGSGSGDSGGGGGGGVGEVLSVNGETGNVVLNADHISDNTTSHKFVSEAERTKLQNLDLNDYVLADSLALVATSGSYGDLTGKPTIPAQFNPIAGANMSITGTYPDLTFNASIERPAIPLLLLSPDVSRDRDGAVVPTIDGSAPVVAGEYGNAWNVTSGQITTPSLAGHGDEGTILIRTLHTGDTSQASARLVTTNTSALAQRIQIFHTTAGLVRVNTPTDNQTMASGFPPNQWSFIAIRWDGTTIDVPDFGFSGPMSADLTEGQLRISSTSNGARWFGLVESMLVYDTALSDAEIARISNLNEAWTWENVTAQLDPHDHDERYYTQAQVDALIAANRPKVESNGSSMAVAISSTGDHDLAAGAVTIPGLTPGASMKIIGEVMLRLIGTGSGGNAAPGFKVTDGASTTTFVFVSLPAATTGQSQQSIRYSATITVPASGSVTLTPISRWSSGTYSVNYAMATLEIWPA